MCHRIMLTKRTSLGYILRIIPAGIIFCPRLLGDICMVWRDGEAPGFGSAVSSDKSRNSAMSSAKITLLMVVMTFLLVTVVLVALQPRSAAAPTFSAEASEEQAVEPVVAVAVAQDPVEAVEEIDIVAVTAPAPAPAPRPTPVAAEQEVSRADASLLELRQAVRSREASDVLRQLAGTTGSGPDDLPSLARSVLGGFGYPVREGDRLHALLVASLSNQKSDAYIDALLNTAVARGEFNPPYALTLPTGRMDTYTLLQAMVTAASG